MRLQTIFTSVLATVLMALLAMPLQAQSGKKELTPDRVVTMKGTDDLKFTVQNIKAHPGEVIKVKLTTVSDYSKQAMAHNFVLLSLDADPQEVANKAAQAYNNNYIPRDMDKAIIAHTGLAGNGETVSVTFKVPGQPGDYPYICSFPGHFASGMKGTLKVRAGKAAL